jgi:hypothetical protein
VVGGGGGAVVGGGGWVVGGGGWVVGGGGGSVVVVGGSVVVVGSTWASTGPSTNSSTGAARATPAAVTMHLRPNRDRGVNPGIALVFSASRETEPLRARAPKTSCRFCCTMCSTRYPPVPVDGYPR